MWWLGVTVYRQTVGPYLSVNYFFCLLLRTLSCYSNIYIQTLWLISNRQQYYGLYVPLCLQSNVLQLPPSSVESLVQPKASSSRHYSPAGATTTKVTPLPLPCMHSELYTRDYKNRVTSKGWCYSGWSCCNSWSNFAQNTAAFHS